MSLTEADAPAARPYGIVGLIVSIPLVLAATVIISVATVVAPSLVAFGWQGAIDQFVDIASSDSDPIFREKAGILVSLIAYAALSAVILGAARIRGKAEWREIVAWRPWHPLRGAAWTWGLAVLLIVYSLGANAAMTHFAPWFTPIVHIPPGIRWKIAFACLAAVFAPVAEELLFRGWLYTSLRAVFGAAASIVVVSVLFALAHWERTHLYALAVFPVGLGLAWIRERTGSIKASMAVHGFYNGIAAVLLFFTS